MCCLAGAGGAEQGSRAGEGQEINKAKPFLFPGTVELQPLSPRTRVKKCVVSMGDGCGKANYSNISDNNLQNDESMIPKKSHFTCGAVSFPSVFPLGTKGLLVTHSHCIFSCPFCKHLPLLYLYFQIEKHSRAGSLRPRRYTCNCGQGKRTRRNTGT